MNKITANILTVLLIIILIFNTSVFATNTLKDIPYGFNTDIILTVEPSLFLATVPIRLSIEMDAYGAIVIEDNLIKNKSHGPIIISSIILNTKNWTYSSINDNFASKHIDSKEFAMSINGLEFDEYGILDISSSDWTTINGEENSQIDYLIKVSPTTSVLIDENIADITFILDWDILIEEIVTPGEIVIDGNYKYTYRNQSFDSINAYGWSVSVLDFSKVDYYPPLIIIKGKPVLSYEFLFMGYRNENLNLMGKWINTNVIIMDSMVANSTVKYINGLENFYTPNLISARSMFCRSDALYLDVSKFNFSKVITTTEMFCESKAISIVGLETLNTQNVLDMKHMFAELRIKSLSLNKFVINPKTDLTGILKNSKVEVIYLGNIKYINALKALIDIPANIQFELIS